MKLPQQPVMNNFKNINLKQNDLERKSFKILFKMKKIIIASLSIVILVSAIFMACSKDNSEIDAIQDPVIVKFLESKTFLRAKTTIESYGTIAYNEIQSGIINHGELKISVIGIPIFENGVKIGVVEAVDLKTDKFLPYGDSYALNYENIKKFDLKTLTGTIEMADLSYDNYVHSVIEVKNNLIKSYKYNLMPLALKSKYMAISNPNKLKSLKAEVLCDGNGNGNVSWGECYHCLKEAIDANGYSQAVCDIPIAGWVSCPASVAAACVYISAMY